MAINSNDRPSHYRGSADQAITFRLPLAARQQKTGSFPIFPRSRSSSSRLQHGATRREPVPSVGGRRKARLSRSKVHRRSILHLEHREQTVRRTRGATMQFIGSRAVNPGPPRHGVVRAPFRSPIVETGDSSGLHPTLLADGAADAWRRGRGTGEVAGRGMVREGCQRRRMQRDTGDASECLDTGTVVATPFHPLLFLCLPLSSFPLLPFHLSLPRLPLSLPLVSVSSSRSTSIVALSSTSWRSSSLRLSIPLRSSPSSMHLSLLFPLADIISTTAPASVHLAFTRARRGYCIT